MRENYKADINIQGNKQSAFDECVILLHGLGRSSRSLKKLASMLSEKGYYTLNIDYPSTTYEIERLAGNTINSALKQCPEGYKVHFVSHSMGGILIRQYLAIKSIPQLGRIVMLAPPNKGSQVVDYFRHIPIYKLIMGPAGMQLGTKKSCVPNKIGEADFDVGIIAGNRIFNWILSTMLPNPNDGKVAVENTKLDGMTDHLVLPVSHDLMTKNQHVIEQVAYYLVHGQFRR